MRTRLGGFSVHPKVEKLKTLLIEHFTQKGLEAEGQGSDDGEPNSNSRAMVFASFRQSVGLITESLNKEWPLIRAVPFMGQSVDKHGKKGCGQKEQLEVRS